MQLTTTSGFGFRGPVGRFTAFRGGTGTAELWTTATPADVSTYSTILGCPSGLLVDPHDSLIDESLWKSLPTELCPFSILTSWSNLYSTSLAVA